MPAEPAPTSRPASGSSSRLPSRLRAALTWLGLVRPTHAHADHARLGARGEALAARLLSDAGYRVLARNARALDGEADLICESPDGRTIVFVEVKSRSVRAADAVHRNPEMGMTARKWTALRRTCRALVKANAWENRTWRIDVVAIEFESDDPSRSPAVRHYVNAG